MIKAGKFNSIRIVRWIIDVIVFTGGTIVGATVLLTIAVRFMGTPFASMSQWPVRILFGESYSLALTMIDLNQSAANQLLVEAIPGRAILSLVGIKSFALIGFDIAWILLSYGTFLMVALILRKIFIQMDSNNFFDHQTPVRLRLIGWTIIIASVLKSLFTYLFGVYASTLLSDVPLSHKTTVLTSLGKPVPVLTQPLVLFSYDQLLIGTVILALAIAFQKGLELKQEQALIV